MTVGGSTIGNATIACTAALARDRVRANHHPSGVQITSNTSIVIAANCTDSHSGAAFTH